MTEISIAPISRIIKSANVKRVSADAKKYLVELTENYAKKVSAEAVKLCEAGGRETITSDDIKLAAKRVIF